MTAKTTVTITGAQTELGDLLAFYWVTVRLVHGGSGGSVDGHVVGGEGSTKFQLDDTGSGTFDVYPNSAITPAGTYYAVSVDGTSPLVVRLLDVPTSGPVDWADNAIQMAEPSPPVAVPRAESGSAFDVLQVSADGARYELAAPTGGGGADHEVDLFIGDTDMTGGGFTTIATIAFGSLARSGFIGADVLVIDGDDLGVWTVTASGPCTFVASLAPNETVSSAIGEFAAAQSFNGATVTAVVRMADADGLSVTAAGLTAEIADRTAAITAEEDARIAGDSAASSSSLELQDVLLAEATERLSTAPRFDLCGDDGAPHSDSAYLTDPLPDFTTGAYWRFTITARPDFDPNLTTLFYSEIATQTHDAGVGSFDNYEIAVQWIFDTDKQVWRATLFLEWTEIGGIAEVHSLATENASSAAGVTYPAWEFPPGVPVEIAVNLDFANGDGNWDLSFWRRIHFGTAEATFDNADWVRISRVIGTGPTSIDTGVSTPHGFGMGDGKIELFDLTIRDQGPTGTILANPTAVEGYAAGDGVAFTDGAGNTWTPGADAHVYVPSSSGLALGETSSTAYRGDRGKTAYDHSQTVTGNPHGTTAADVGAVPTSRTVNGHALSANVTVTASDIGAASFSFVTSIQSVTSSTTLANTTGLSFAVVNGGTYPFRAVMFVTAAATGDLRVGITCPTGTLIAAVDGPAVSVGGFATGAQLLGVITASGGSVTGIGAFGTITRVVIEGSFIATANGTVQIQHAQNVSDGTATSVLVGSYITGRW